MTDLTEAVAEVLRDHMVGGDDADDLWVDWCTDTVTTQAAAILDALPDLLAEHPEAFGLEAMNPPASATWRAFLSDVAQPPEVYEMGTDDRVRWGTERGWNRQCSLGWHSECSDGDGVNHLGECACPCHRLDKGQLILACLQLEAERLALYRLPSRGDTPKEATDE